MKMKKLDSILPVLVVGFMLLILVACGKKDDETTESSGLFANSFDHITTYPEPVIQNFAREDHTLVRATVFSGQIILLTNGANAEEVTQLISENNGIVMAQIPNAGLYLATIDVAEVNTFLSAMYQSPMVEDAFPNPVIYGKGNLNDCGAAVVKGDAGSIVQTIDVSADMGCNDNSGNNLYHTDAVGAVAAANGISANVNDVTVYGKETESAGADSYKSMQKMLELLNYGYEHNLPVVINMSMNGDESIELDTYWYNKRFCYLLKAVEMKTPHLLDNAVIFISGANANVNETEDYTQLYENDFKDSPIWDHLYFVNSQEGQNGCDLGYVDNGTSNVLSAPGCNIPIPNSACVVSGNSFSAPYISNLVAQAYELLQKAGIDVGLPEITSKLWTYQNDNLGKLPTAFELYSICAGNGGFGNKYDGVWTGTFYYTAKVPQESGPPTVVNTSFNLSITLLSTASVPGYPQLLSITSATCSDPTFGATSPVVPDASQSMAFLPATFGSASLQGMTITIKFPNGSGIFTSNFIDGAFTVDVNGRMIASTNLVADEAFSASGNDGDSNTPGSGPGGYAYNWCTFKSWSIVR